MTQESVARQGERERYEAELVRRSRTTFICRTSDIDMVDFMKSAESASTPRDPCYFDTIEDRVLASFGARDTVCTL